MTLENSSLTPVDPEKMAETMADVIARSQQIATEFITNQSGHLAGSFDPARLGEQFLKNMAQFSFDPQALMEAQAEFWQGSLALWQQTALGSLGASGQKVIEPTEDDRRFRSDAWDDGHVFDFIKQS